MELTAMPSSNAEQPNLEALDAEVDVLLKQMSVEEKVGLLSGRNMWKAGGVPRLGIPELAMSDGPHGMRGFGLGGEAGAVLAPCSLALAATFDESLICEVGALLGEDCHRRGGSVLLGPCINMQRSPLFGRHFECFSEDPYLTGRASVAYIKGVQQHVAACAKHFVCNDQEKNRHTLNAVIDEATLREVYLAPFEAAVTEGNVESIMCGYNRLNGVYCTENQWLLQKVLREEWRFQGWLVSDWFGNQSTVSSLHAGLNVEMPGIEPRHYGGYLLEACHAGRVPDSLLNERCRPVLRTSIHRKATPWPGPPLQAANGPGFSQRRSLLLRAASSSMVLLRNEGAALPLESGAIRRLAIVGPNAAVTTIQGGGSSRVRPRPCANILQALQAVSPRITVLHEPGCLRGDHQPHHPEFQALRIIAGCNAAGQASSSIFDSVAVVFDAVLTFAAGISNNEFFRRCAMPVLRILGVRQSDPVKIAKQLAKKKQEAPRSVHEEVERSERLNRYASLSVIAALAILAVWAGRSSWHRVSSFAGAAAVTVGAGLLWHTWRRNELKKVEEKMLEAAEWVAKESDACVVVLGTDADFEGEGDDQPDMKLPGRQNELVERVAAVSRGPVIVVLNVGSPKELPWINSVSAVLLAHFGGEEMAQAVADTLFGVNCPAGRLPTTWPKRLEDAPSQVTTNSVSVSGRELVQESTTLLGAPTTRPLSVGHEPLPGECVYSECLRIGYRSFACGGRVGFAAPLFPFGHGLSYTTFTYGDATASMIVPCAGPGGAQASVSIVVKNAGGRKGREVVQLYTEAEGGDAAGDAAGPRSLRGFLRTAELAPGDQQSLTFTLGSRALGSFYSTQQAAWTEPQPGTQIRIEVGSSSSDVRAVTTLALS